MYRVGILARMGAAAIDGVLATVLLIASAIIAVAAGSDVLGYVLFYLLLLLYSGMEVAFAATPGKLLLGLRVARQDGRDAERSRLWLRWATKYYFLLPSIFDTFFPGTIMSVASGMVTCIVLCGFLGAFNDDRLTWHDQWAGTAVWKRRPSAPVTLSACRGPSIAVS